MARDLTVRGMMVQPFFDKATDETGGENQEVSVAV